MWPEVFAALPPLWLILGAFLIAGWVKGVSGIGLPMTALGILTTQTDPRTAITLSLVPILMANLWQFVGSGGVVAALKRYLPFLVTMVIGIPLTLALTSSADARFMYAALGTTFLLFVAITSTKWAPHIPDRHDLPAQLGFGALAGVLGGLTSLWLPAIVIYLSARDTRKEEFIRASGLLLVAGSIPLVSGYWREGFLTGSLSAVSALMLLPTLAGMMLGQRLRGRLSEKAFRRVLLFVFALVGLNLIRRSVMG